MHVLRYIERCFGQTVLTRLHCCDQPDTADMETCSDVLNILTVLNSFYLQHVRVQIAVTLLPA